MRTTQPLFARNRTSRRGTAPIELVLSLPILLLLAVGIIWLGTSVIAQSEVIFKARQATWEKRSQPTGKALLFLKDDIVSETADEKVDAGPMFSDAESPESSHDVMAGSWSHDKMRLDKAPNWKQYAIAAVNAKTGSAQVTYTDAQNRFSGLSSESGNIWNTLAVGLIKQLTGLGDAANSALENSEQDKSDQTEARRKLTRQINEKQSELRRTQQRIRELDSGESKVLRDILKNKEERLESEIADLRSDRKAVDE